MNLSTCRRSGCRCFCHCLVWGLCSRLTRALRVDASRWARRGMDESLSIEDVRRLASECGGLREIYFSRRSNKVSFARDATDGKASG